jgi:hypothetical protein
MSKRPDTPYTKHSAVHYMADLSFQVEEISKKNWTVNKRKSYILKTSPHNTNRCRTDKVIQNCRCHEA